MVQSRKDQYGVGTFVVHNQPHEISNPRSTNSQKRDVIGSIQLRFVY